MKMLSWSACPLYVFHDAALLNKLLNMHVSYTLNLALIVRCFSRACQTLQQPYQIVQTALGVHDGSQVRTFVKVLKECIIDEKFVLGSEREHCSLLQTDGEPKPPARFR